MVGGGSIGGLCAGIALAGAGADVQIFEHHAGAMEPRGAGIVVQPELSALLHRHDAPPLPVTSCRARRYLEPDGGPGQTQVMPQSFTSWVAIYRTLQATFPDTHYHTGAALEGFENRKEEVLVRIAGHDQMRADLLVCSDGAKSTSRSRLLPDVHEHYAGYIAWRGTVEESEVPHGLAEFFNETFTFSEARSGGHMLVYFIPGANADASVGQRRLNWVWYVHASEDDLEQLLRDREGRRHHNSLPIGGATGESIARLRALARREVHPRMTELIEQTPQPFMQKIFDVVVPRTVFGRACLLGDAAFVVRPHTAGATAKAARDATLLAESLAEADGAVSEALHSFEKSQLEYGYQLHRYGVALGNRWAAAR